MSSFSAQQTIGGRRPASGSRWAATAVAASAVRRPYVCLLLIEEATGTDGLLSPFFVR